jgi:hypothetical protein
LSLFLFFPITYAAVPVVILQLAIYRHLRLGSDMVIEAVRI